MKNLSVNEESLVRADDVIRFLLEEAYFPDDAGSPDDGAQLVDGEWYMPAWGCDTLQYVVDGVRGLAQPLDGKK